MKLTARQISTAKPQDKPYKLADGGGLYLLVNPNGSRYWRLKYRLAGKEKLLSIGVFPDVTLAEARNKRNEAKRLLANGEDPSEVKQAEKHARILAVNNSLSLLRLNGMNIRNRIGLPVILKTFSNICAKIFSLISVERRLPISNPWTCFLF